MNVVLFSTYELGHQPFGLASPAAWLRGAGAAVTCVDLAVEGWSGVQTAVREADLLAFYVPMHTATRLAMGAIRRARRMNGRAHVCAYGLYAPLNGELLRGLGVDTILGGEFEQGLVDLVRELAAGQVVDLPPISLARQQFLLPDRSGLPELAAYAHLEMGDGEPRLAGYTEASRGCKHLCRHCPIVPVYNGRFRVVQPEVVLADVRQQVGMGAQHITFGDPDFFNGPTHALRIVRALHEEFPQVTYDCTIKVEHLLKHAALLPVLRETGCLFVTSAVESVDEQILAYLDKGHTRADFEEAVAVLRKVGLTLQPTFVTFTPWTTVRGYAELLGVIAALGLVEAAPPIQYAIRLLIPAGSRLLDLAEVRELVRPFDEQALVYPWSHPDTAVDALYEAVFKLVKASQNGGETRRVLFERIWQLVAERLPAGEKMPPRPEHVEVLAVPTMSEDWY